MNNKTCEEIKNKTKKKRKKGEIHFFQSMLPIIFSFHGFKLL